MYGLGLDGYDPDSQHDAAVAFRIRVVAQEQYIPLHQHRKGQLIMALGGAITCEVENAMLMVPPQYAVWIPGQTPHSNKATPGAQLCLLFIEPGALELPTRTCTLKISPLVRELVLALADRSREELPLPATGRLVDVLFDELPLQPQEHLQLRGISASKNSTDKRDHGKRTCRLADAGAVGKPLCHERTQSGAAGGERDRLKLSPLAAPAPADCRIAVFDRRKVGSAGGAGAGV